MSAQPPANPGSPARSDSSREQADLGATSGTDEKHPVESTPATVTGLVAKETQYTQSAFGDANLSFPGIRKGPKKDVYDLDAVGIAHDSDLCTASH